MEIFYHSFSEKKELLTHASYIGNPRLLMTSPLNDLTEVILNKTGHKWQSPEFEHMQKLLI